MDRYGNYYHPVSGLWRSLRDGDFEESEVWDVLRERKGRDLEASVTSLPSEHTNRYAPAHPPATRKMIPQSSTSRSRSSSINGSVSRSILAHQSAPVNIPNWSNVRRHLGRSESSKAPKSRPWRNGDEDEDDDDDDDDDGGEDDDEDEDDEYGLKLPPHEYMAMRLARSKISSFSVLEGVGRKLKGRDLSNVRNDVLTKTGFLESP